jgi:hypothetical protein
MDKLLVLSDNHGYQGEIYVESVNNGEHFLLRPQSPFLDENNNYKYDIIESFKDRKAALKYIESKAYIKKERAST